MATSSPLNIKSAARKLPIKRKNPPLSQAQPLSNSQPVPVPVPVPNPNPNPPSLSSYPVAIPTPHSAYAYDDDDPDAEYEEEELEGEDGDSKQPPFKFHRIWPESDEIRFLQGLLGCWSQGLVFPRDLNIFYDRFSESMSQPYTRSQLSEKLRRLRKKYRTMAGRIARGQDPSRLSQHDRDLLHLSTRLWDPSNASSSPFSAPDAVPAGSTGNKRRRPNPRTPTCRARTSSSPLVVALESASLPHPQPLLTLTSHASPSSSASPTEYIKEFADPSAPIAQNGSLLYGTDASRSHEKIPKKEFCTSPTNNSLGVRTGIKHLTIKSVLNVFDESLKEVRSTLTHQGFIPFKGSSELTEDMKNLSKRFQLQKLEELDLFAQRWRLLIEEEVTQS